MVVLASIDSDKKNLVDQVTLIQKPNLLSQKYGILCLQKSEFAIPKIRDSKFVNPGITGLKKVPGSRDYIPYIGQAFAVIFCYGAISHLLFMLG